MLGAFASRSRTAWSPRRGSPSAAWRRSPSARADAEAALAGQALDARPRSRPRCRRSPRTSRRSTDMRASAGYRLKVGANLLRRLFIETTRADELETPSGRRPEPRPCLSSRGLRARSRAASHAAAPPRQRRAHVARRGALYRRHARAGGHAAPLPRPSAPGPMPDRRGSTSSRCARRPAWSPC